MRKRFGILLGTMVAVLFATLTVGAADKGTAQQVQEETRELIEALKAYGIDQREEALKRTQAAMEQADKRLEALQKRMEEKWDAMDKGAREKAQETREALRRQRRELGTWSDKFKEGSADAWDQLKQGFADAYRAFNNAWDKAGKDLDSKD